MGQGVIRAARPEELQAEYRALAAKEASAAGLPVSLVHAVIDRESAWNPTAVSPKGARGLMQLMPDTAKSLGVDPDDPVQNIQGGVRYLRQLADQFGGDTTKALAAYNAGPGAVTRYGGVPPYPETQGYVAALTQNQPAQLPAAQTGRIRPATPEELTGRGLLGGPDAKISAGPPLPTRFSRFATPLVGALAGGMKGAAIGAPGGPVGMFVGGVTGAGIGAGLAEGVQAGFEYLTSDAPPTPTGIARRVGSATQTGMVGEGTGRAIVPVVGAVTRPLMRPMASKLEPYAGDAMATFKTGAPPRPAVLPAEVSSSRLLDVTQNIAEGSFLGGGRISAVKEARQYAAENKVLEVLDTLGPQVGTKATGEAVKQSRQTAIQAFRAQERPAWERFQELTREIPLGETPALDAFLSEVTEQQAGAILPNAGVVAARRVAELTGEGPMSITMGGVQTNFLALPPSVQSAIAQAGAAPPMPGRLSVGQFQKTVSNLGTVVRRLERAAATDPTKNADLGLAKRVYRAAQEDLEGMLETVPIEARTAYDTARAISVAGNKTLFNREVLRLAKVAPEKVTQRLLQRNNSTAIEAVRKAVDPETFGQVQATAMSSILSASPKTGRINWGQVASKLNRLGDDTLGAMFPGGHASEVRRVANLMLRLSEKQAGGMGKTAIQLSQGGAMIGVATGGPLQRGVMEITLVPYAMARIFSSPTGLKWLTTGLTAPKGSPEAIRAATQLLAFAGREVEEGEEPSGPPVPSRATGAGPRAEAGPPRPQSLSR